MKYSCVIVEDEPLALERTKAFAEKMPLLQVVATFHSAIEAYAWLREHEADLLFLDIELGDVSGIQLLESIDFKGQVILTTAYEQYAIKGFDLRVCDYLLKPFRLERFLQAVGRAMDQLQQTKTNTVDFIFVKTEHRLEKVVLEEVLYVEGMRDYRRIHSMDKRIMTLSTFGELEAVLPPEQFCRIHKSYLVALNKISKIEKDRIFLDQVVLPLSETYRQQFYDKIKQP